MLRNLWLLGLALICGGCVSVSEPILAPQSAAPGQRTVLIIYPATGPWVISESESKAEAAARSLPIFSAMVQSLQEDRDQKASDDLRQYMPVWAPSEKLYPLLMKELANTGFVGKFLYPYQADIATAAVRNLNRATDSLDWQKRYLYGDPAQPLPRDYSRFLNLDDALVLEANLLYYLAADDDGNMIPTLSLVSRLIRCQTMHLLWKHEDKVEDPGAAKSIYEFKTLPLQLVDRWQGLMPALAAKASASLRTALVSAAPSAAVSPAPSAAATIPEVSFSTPAAAAPAPADAAASAISVSSAAATGPAAGVELSTAAALSASPPATPPEISNSSVPAAAPASPPATPPSLPDGTAPPKAQ
ncbi:MAG: hypothetical protein WC881_08670 [Elusimicrobiota bacterium]